MLTIPVFISHSWSYSEHYDSLAEWLFGDDWQVNLTPLNFVDASVPRHSPIHDAANAAELKNAIWDRIALSDVVVIPTGMYCNYSNWIAKEIEGAAAYGKPILAVNPWSQERKSSVVGEAAQKIVGWNKQSVADGVWALSPYGRH